MWPVSGEKGKVQQEEFMKLVFTLPFGLPSLNGLILGAVIYTVLMKITKKQVIKED